MKKYVSNHSDRDTRLAYSAPWSAYWKYLFRGWFYRDRDDEGWQNDSYYYYPYGTDLENNLITSTNFRRGDGDFRGNQLRAATERQIVLYLASAEYSEAREEWYDTIIDRYGEQKIIDVANVFSINTQRFPKSILETTCQR